MKTQGPTVQYTLRVPTQLLERAEAVAKATRRSLAFVVNECVQKTLPLIEKELKINEDPEQATADKVAAASIRLDLPKAKSRRKAAPDA